MITRKPKTAKGFLYYHRLMWGRIVKEMEKGATLDNDLKKRVWKNLFGFEEMTNHCFACAFKKTSLSCENDCLLEYQEDDGKCLGGLFDAATGISQYKIKAASMIRDLPMKDKWK